jgi:hypothetical protein
MECAICHKTITEPAEALVDKTSGGVVHFDCILRKMGEREKTENNETVCYIGGGRFGIVERPNPRDMRFFKIKRIIEYEKSDERAHWRDVIADHYSMT